MLIDATYVHSHYRVVPQPCSFIGAPHMDATSIRHRLGCSQLIIGAGGLSPAIAA